MGFRSTHHYKRTTALSVFEDEIPDMSNDLVKALLREVAESQESRIMAADDVLTVSEFGSAQDFRVSRERGLEILRTEIQYLSNKLVGDLLDTVAYTGRSSRLSNLYSYSVHNDDTEIEE